MKKEWFTEKGSGFSDVENSHTIHYTRCESLFWKGHVELQINSLTAKSFPMNVIIHLKKNKERIIDSIIAAVIPPDQTIWDRDEIKQMLSNFCDSVRCESRTI